MHLTGEDRITSEYDGLKVIDNEILKINKKIDPKKRIDINIGFDLGTSNSKVVWRYNNKSYPLCFGKDPYSLSSYLYPSTVYFDGVSLQTSYDVSFDSASKIEYTVTNFKVCMACVHNTDSNCKPDRCSLTVWNLNLFDSELKGHEVSFIMTYFIASVLSKARNLILIAFENKYGKVNPENVRWSINLAVPNRYLMYSNVKEEYSKALKAGWLMSSLLDQQLNQSSAILMNAYYLHAMKCAKNKEMDCFVIPETVAEVTSFIRSKRTSDGLYVLIDIGAGTVDATVFRLYTPTDAVRQISDYASSVLNPGSAFIESLAFYWFSENDWYLESQTGCEEISRQYAENYLRTTLRLMKENDGQNISDYKTIPDHELRKSLVESSARIKVRVHSLLKHLFNEAYLVEKNIDHWLKLKVIFGGGGAKSLLYKEASTDAFTIFYQGKKIKPQILEFNSHEDFSIVDIGEKHFHRFAVAYGLSLSEIEIATYYNESEISPVVKQYNPVNYLLPGYY